jgi:hypothetical protein
MGLTGVNRAEIEEKRWLIPGLSEMGNIGIEMDGPGLVSWTFLNSASLGSVRRMLSMDG